MESLGTILFSGLIFNLVAVIFICHRVRNAKKRQLLEREQHAEFGDLKKRQIIEQGKIIVAQEKLIKNKEELIHEKELLLNAYRQLNEL